MAEQHSAAYKPLKQGMALLKDKKFLDAYDFFSAATAASLTPDLAPSPIALAFSNLCLVKLGMPLPTTAPSHSANPIDTISSPVDHMIKALGLDATASSTSPARGLAAQRKLDSQATGQALAYLLHPATQQLPGVLSEEVKQVLHRRASAMASFTSPSRGDAAGGSSKQRGEAELTRWYQKAVGIDSLTEILQMTGLDSIKREMFNLYDQVGISEVFLSGHPISKNMHNQTSHSCKPCR